MDLIFIYLTLIIIVVVRRQYIVTQEMPKKVVIRSTSELPIGDNMELRKERDAFMFIVRQFNL